jgi:hypothetical protein
MMCEECDSANEPLRDAYLALRARKAKTWTPRRFAVRVAAAPAAAQSGASDTGCDDVGRSAHVGKNVKAE